MVGVVYHPDTEEKSHYVMCSLCDQFDCLVYIDESSALVHL